MEDFAPILALGLIASLCAALLLAWRRRGPDDSPFVACFRIVNAILTHSLHRVRISPEREPLPRRGGCIVVANHRSGVDPLLIGAVTKRWIRFVMAREYYEKRALHWIFRRLECIPVKRDGRDLGALRASVDALRAGRVVGVFPQGGIRDPEDDLDVAKAGVAYLAARGRAPVVPFYIEGSPPCESVFAALFHPSRSRVHAGAPLAYPAGETPSREGLEKFTSEVLAAIQRLRQEAARTSGRPREELPRDPCQSGDLPA